MAHLFSHQIDYVQEKYQATDFNLWFINKYMKVIQIKCVTSRTTTAQAKL